MSTWDSATIGDVSHVVTKGTTPTSMGRPFTTSGIPFVKVESIKENGSVDLRKTAFIDEETHELLRRSALRVDDILFTIAGTIGRAARVTADIVPGNTNQAVAVIRPDVRKVEPRFVLYCLRDEQRVRRAQSRVVQSVQANLSLSELRSVEILLPPLDEQKEIVSVLGALDDKITVNERIAAKADELLRVMYQDACNRAFDSIAIGALGKLVRDGVPVSSLTGEGNYIGLEHMPRRNMWLTAWETDAEVTSGKSRFTSGDVLFGKLRPYFHKVGIALNSGVCSTDILVVRPVEDVRLGWLLLALSSDEVVAHASAVGDGTRMPRAKWKDLETFHVPWPGADRVGHLNDVVRSMAARIGLCVAESQALATLRDTLLPQLMSGRLRIKDAERIVEDAT
ncbi:restriction endonuclease subunit S [Streptomyces sp. SAI-229]|uniref:restriction endonuclease subunit S n=1 Tax=Streptomyces sp. SAI-229 TaxID=3377731 RepID=UPI003C79A5DD